LLYKVLRTASGFWEKVDLGKGDDIETDPEKEREGMR
jgi:hypothetical protein